MNVFDFFVKQGNASGIPMPAQSHALTALAVGNDTFGTIMHEMPAMSPCGADCCEAIRNGMSFAKSIRDTFGNDRDEDLDNVLRILCDVVACKIRG